MAFSVLMAHRAGLGYTKALTRLDEFVKIQVDHVVRRSEQAFFARLADFDVTRGLSGTGRYLLARGDTGSEALKVVLRRLVRMTEPIAHKGCTVPGLWAMEGPRQGTPDDTYQDGHLNLGLAHGIAGPLSLLSLAYREGVVVGGHQEAIERLVDIFLDFAMEDQNGVYWPRLLTLDDWRRGAAAEVRSRPSWCYGVPGVTRAIQLAALALDRPHWHTMAQKSLLPLLSTPLEEFGIEDAGLCHGWAGLLHLIRACNSTMHDQRFTELEHRLAERVLRKFDPEYSFAFRTAMLNTPQGADMPGFLDGAGGIALALESYAEGDAAFREADGEPTGWQAALLIS